MITRTAWTGLVVVGLMMSTAVSVDAAPKKKGKAPKKSTSRSAPASRFPAWDKLPVSTVRLQRGKLLLGLTDGGVAMYNEESGAPINVVRGSGIGPASEVLWEGNHAWWINTGTGKLHFATSFQRTPGEVNLANSGMTEPPRRISLWQGRLIVQGRSQIRVVEPDTKRVLRPEEYFARDMAVMLEQGTVMSSWYSRREGGGEGQLVLIRRYSKRSADLGGKRETTAITAWNSTGRNYKLLSTYVRPLVDFTEAPGPRVRYTLGKRVIDEPFAFCETGNLQINELGVVALDENVLLTVPLRTDKWVPDEIDLRVRPKFANSMSASSNNAWWTDGSKIFCASVDSGMTDVYFPTDGGGRVTDLAADDDGVWVARGGSLRRVVASSEGKNGFGGYVRYPALSDQTDMTAGETALRAKLQNPGVLGPWDLVMAALQSAGWTGARLNSKIDLAKVGRRIRGELVIGDVLANGSEPAVYIGNGETVSLRAGRLVQSPLAWSAGTEVYRLLETRSLAAFRPGATGPADFDPYQRPSVAGSYSQRVPFVGLGKPNPNLGHNMFVAVNIGGKYDRPWLPAHQTLLEEGKSWFGTRYVYGGSTRNGIDCSAFVQNVFRACGVNIPRTSALMGQTTVGQVVTDELRFGDVLVFPGHVAIYVGDGRTFETVRGAGVSSSRISRRDRAIVRRFILPQ